MTAAAVVAHLLYLLATEHPVEDGTVVHSAAPPGVLFDNASIQPAGVQSEPYSLTAAQRSQDPATVQLDAGAEAAKGARPAPTPARDRAEAAATRHAQRRGLWPTVTELEAAAEVSRGTAAAALKSLRERPLPLHLINTDPEPTDEPDDEAHR